MRNKEVEPRGNQTEMFSDLTTHVAQVAVRLGARKVAASFGKSPEELQLELKAEAGSTPRTVADLNSGKIIRQLIRREFPWDRINEEETGEHPGTTEQVWYVDPLDGTSSFAREQTYSNVGVAVYRSGEPFSAAICQPFDRELLIAEKGKGAHLITLRPDLTVDTAVSPRRIHCSDRSLQGGSFYVDAFFNANTSGPKLKFMGMVIQDFGEDIGFRMTGSNIDQQRQVAAGRAEATLTDAVGGFYDLAAGGLIIQEAGGIFTDIFGNPVTKKTQVAIGSNGKNHDELLAIAQECYHNYNGFK